MSDLRAAVEVLPGRMTRGDDYFGEPAVVSRAEVLALIDAHQCHDEATLAEAMAQTIATAQPDYPSWAAAIIARLQK